MGFVTRFESGKRKDAVIRNTEQDIIALEWEWEGVWGNELEKLKHHKVWSKDKGSERLLKYAVLITYTHTPNIEKVYTHVIEEWKEARYSLLLILIDLEESKKFSHIKNLRIYRCLCSTRVSARSFVQHQLFPGKFVGHDGLESLND